MGDIGYETHNTILNLSTLYYVIWLYVAKVVLFLILHVAQRRQNWLNKHLKDSLFWGEILTIMIEGYMELYISGYLEYQYPLTTSNGEKQARIIGYICLFFSLILLPGILFWIQFQDQETLK